MYPILHEIRPRLNFQFRPGNNFFTNENFCNLVVFGRKKNLQGFQNSR